MNCEQYFMDDIIFHELLKLFLFCAVCVRIIYILVAGVDRGGFVYGSHRGRC